MTSVSLVIPAYNIESIVDRCLTAALSMLDRGEIVEVIFVDNNSTDKTRDLAQRYAVKLLDCPKSGASAARNIGWQHASGDYIWFVDADCRVDSSALTNLLETVEKFNVEVASGGYLNDTTSSVLADLIQKEFDYRYARMHGFVTYLTTCNLLCKKNTLIELNGFSEGITCVEDGDFAFRLQELDKQIVFNSDSRVFHLHARNLMAYLKKQAFHGYWAVYVYSRHPNRVLGHSYTNFIDHVQPFLVFSALVSALFSGLFTVIFFLLFLMAQFPIMRFIYSNGSLLEALNFALLSFIRTIARLLGICLGLLSAFFNAVRNL